MNIPTNRLPRLAADIVRTLRRSYGLNQEQFAKLLGVSRVAVCNWETGRFRAPTDLEARLANASLTNIGIETMHSLKAKDKARAVAMEDARSLLSLYRDMRKQRFSHRDIVDLWTRHGTRISPEAQNLIAQAYPDVIDTGIQALLDKAFDLPPSPLADATLSQSFSDTSDPGHPANSPQT